MAALIVVVGANVVCRYVLGIPLSWAEEAARYMMIYMAYLAAPLALRAGGHIRITVLTDRLRGVWADVFRMVGHLMVGSLAVTVAYHGWSLIQLVSFQQTPAMRISMSVPYFSVVVGSAFLALEAAMLFVADAVKMVGELSRGSNARLPHPE